MARRRIVELIDDLEGGPATRTVRFGLDGQLFEVDLNEANATRLRGLLESYATVARRINPASNRPYRELRLPDDPRTIRAWALSKGLITGSQRVTDAIRARYLEAKRAGDPFAERSTPAQARAAAPAAVFSSR
jgi:hypothetical protein